MAAAQEQLGQFRIQLVRNDDLKPRNLALLDISRRESCRIRRRRAAGCHSRLPEFAAPIFSRATSVVRQK